MPKIPERMSGKIWVCFSRLVTFPCIILRASPGDLGEESNSKGWVPHTYTSEAHTCRAARLGSAWLPLQEEEMVSRLLSPNPAEKPRAPH